MSNFNPTELKRLYEERVDGGWEWDQLLKYFVDHCEDILAHIEGLENQKAGWIAAFDESQRQLKEQIDAKLELQKQVQELEGQLNTQPMWEGMYRESQRQNDALKQQLADTNKGMQIAQKLSEETLKIYKQQLSEANERIGLLTSIVNEVSRER